MSIARAFTTRRVKQSLQAADEGKALNRSNSTNLKGPVGSLRHKISSPIELIHTTNMLSYNAPDIHPLSASSTGSSQRSDDDMSDSAFTNGTTPPTSPDVESPVKRVMSPEPNHLSAFFTVSSQQTPAPAVQPEAPVIPQRAASHSKKPYNTLVRQRSASALSQQSHRTVSTKASFSFSRSSSTSTSTSVSSAPMHHQKSKLSGTVSASASPVAPPFSPTSPPRPQRPAQQPQHHQTQQQHRNQFSETQHPFGPELAQVSELVEEYGVREQLASVVDAEEQEMLARGLLKFSADEYLSEVRGLFASFMIPPPRPVAAAWI